MQTRISELKKELSVIEAVCIFDTNSSSFSHIDPQAIGTDFISLMFVKKCFDQLDHLYISQGKNHYHIAKVNHHIGIARLKERKDVNQTLMTFKIKGLLKSIS